MPVKNQTMRATVAFVILQFILGLGFAITGILLFGEYDSYSLGTSILLSFLMAFICMMIGVGFAGYFHLKIKHALNRFGKAMLASFAGIVLFLILYLLIENFLPSSFGILSLFIPLTGAVFGFNFVVVTSTNDD